MVVIYVLWYTRGKACCRASHQCHRHNNVNISLTSSKVSNVGFNFKKETKLECEKQMTRKESVPILPRILVGTGSKFKDIQQIFVQ